MHASLALPGLRTPLERLALVAPALALALVALPVHYTITLAEPDLARMMAALVYGGASGRTLDPVTHYGIAFSFGYYELLYGITPLAWLRDPDMVARAMNGLGVFSGVLMAVACASYLEKLYGLRTAVLATAVFCLSPLMLPLAFSGHPLVPAAAALFAGGSLLVRARPLAACALLVAALALRAEVALAFPFLWLAGRPTRSGARELALRALVLGGAFFAFLLLQHHYIGAQGGGLTKLAAFVHTFMSLSQLGRGAGVLVLATGFATALAAGLALWRLRAERERLVLLLVLAGPALAFGLPNPSAARHLFFAVLAACIALALYIERSPAASLRRALLVAVALVAANEVLAELARPLIVARYPWSYDPPVERRAAQRVPLGAFLPDQRANQVLARLERDEALELAAGAPRRLLVLAGADEYFIAHFIARYPELRWHERQWHGTYVTELASAERAIAIVDKSSAWPHDVSAEALAQSEWRDWPVYVQRTIASRYDRTPLPAARRFALP
jgi:hypothetical protein